MDLSEELSQIFITESNEIIELLDQEIVRLEAEPDNRELLDEVFRAFHTLKGNAGMVGMSRFEKLSHVTEEVLTEIRDGKRKISSDIVTFLLSSLDELKIMLQAIEQTGTDQVESEGTAHEVQAEVDTELSQETGKRKGKEEQASTPVTDEIVAQDGSGGLFPENVEPKHPEEAQPEPSNGADRESEDPEKSPDKTRDTAAAQEDKSKKSATGNKWGKAETSVRVDVSLLDDLMNHVGELLLSRNQIVQYSESVDDSHFSTTCQRFDVVTSDLQEMVMKARMQPIGNVFGRFPRVVRDITRKSGKKVNLKVEGQETEIDNSIIDAIRDPLTHIVRNSLDHGIEDEDTRKNLGKDPTGTLTLKAYHGGGQVVIEISDDGAGIDPEKLRQKVVEKGLMSAEQANSLSDSEAIDLVFLPGFSTAKQVTSISGRGVGMDVVKTNIANAGGRVEVSSILNEGTSLKIHLPLTMSIIDGLQVRIGNERYLIPLSIVRECVELDPEDSSRNQRRKLANVRGEIIPYIRLREFFRLHREDLIGHQLVITEVGDRRFGIVVDEVIGHYQTVIKGLGKVYQKVEGISGSTILEDGAVALILDAPKIVKMAEQEEEELING